MLKSTIAAVTLFLSVALTACGGSAPSTTALQSLVQSSIGQSLVNNIVNAAAPQVNAALAKGAQASAADLRLIAYWLPWLDKAVDTFGPALGMTAAQIAAADATTATLVADLQNPPADVGSLLADVNNLVTGIMADLKPVTG